MGRLAAGSDGWLLRREAVARLGRPTVEQFLALARQDQVSSDHRGRWPGAVIEAWVADPATPERLRRLATVGPSRAAELLQVRGVDLRWMADREILPPHAYLKNPYYSSAEPMAVWRVGDLEDLAARADDVLPGTAGVTLAAVRATPAGARSLLAIARATPTGPTLGTVIRRWERTARGQWPDLELTYDKVSTRWCVDLPADTEHTTLTRMGRHLLSTLEQAGLTGRKVTIGDPARAMTRYARHALTQARPVILDTETTGLDHPDVVEIGIVDAATGQVLLSRLVKPTKPVEDEARCVHGISDDALADAPTLAQVLPELLAAVDGREVWAYNAEFDRGALAGHAGRERIIGGLGPHLGDPGTWWCLMDAEQTWSRSDRWAPLDGGHRAVGDALAAREVAHRIAGLPMTPDERTRRRDRMQASIQAAMAEARSVVGDGSVREKTIL